MQEQESLKQSLGVKEGDFVFLLVGRLVGDKGINELISAFGNFLQEQRKLNLLVGNEAELDPLEQETIGEINRNENIISVGFKRRTTVPISDRLSSVIVRVSNVVMQADGLCLVLLPTHGCNES
jgi:glycogen synthase